MNHDPNSTPSKLAESGLPFIPPPVTVPANNQDTQDNLSLLEQLAQLADKEEIMSLLEFKQEQQLDNDDELWQFLIQFKTIENAVNKQEDILNLIINQFNSQLKQQLNTNQQKIDASYRTYSNNLVDKFSEITCKLKAAEESSISLTNARIASSVDALVQKAAYKKAISNWFAMSRLGIYVFIPAILTFIGGWLGRSYFDYRYSNSGLSNQDTALLEWARSDEGNLARDLMNWNKRGLTKKGRTIICESEAQKLNFTLKKEGESVRSGWCALWIRSPDQR